MSAARLDRMAVPRRPAHLRFLLTIPLLLGLAGGARPTCAQTVYLAFGDSVTEGVGDDVPEGPDAGYPIRLEGLLGETVLNRGLSGETTPEGVTRLDEVLADDQADVLLLMEGTNDITRAEISEETTLFNLNAMARKAENRGMTVYHGTLIPRLPNAKVDRDNIVNQRVNQSIRDLAGFEFRGVIDNFEVYSSEPSLFSRLYSNEINDPVGHPNADGYDLMAEIFADVLRGVDSVPPVPGLLSPDNGDERVSPNARIAVDVWDFGEGIDLSSVQLRVNDSLVDADLGGSSVQAQLRYTPPAPLEGVVRVSLRASDLVVPANTFDREIAVFTVQGSAPPVSDINLDGRVDGHDLIRLAVAFGTRFGDKGYDRRSDLDDDGRIDGVDLAILASDFGLST